MFSKIREALKGRKTILVGLTTFILGGLAAIGVPVPAWIYVVLGGAGLTTLRIGVNAAIAKAVEKMDV